MGILRSQVNINDLEYIGEAEQPYAAKNASGSGKIRMSKSALVSTEINLIGMTVDEAIADIWTNIWTMLILPMSPVSVLYTGKVPEPLEMPSSNN